METQSDGNEDTIKTLRQQLESRIETQHTAQIDLFSSLQTLIPDIVSSVDLSQKVVSLFNNRPFTPTPVPPSNPNSIRKLKKPLEPTGLLSSPDEPISSRLSVEPKTTSHEDSSVRQSDDDKFTIDESGNPLSVVRSMVAVCLLQRVPFLAVDSSAVLRTLENDQSATAAEKAALRELGGESGGILAVEMALRSMAEDNGGVDLKEFVDSGKSRVMVLGINRTRLLKELPESAQQQDLSSGDVNQCQQQATSGADANGGVYRMGGPIPRPMQDMWLGPGAPGSMMGPRGAPRFMGMMGMPRGMGLPSLQRPAFGQNLAAAGANAIPLKMTSEEDELKDLEAMLNKKSFKELQKSKTGEELLDLIHRPTAKETAVAAKVKNFEPFLRKIMHDWVCNSILTKSIN